MSDSENRQNPNSGGDNGSRHQACRGEEDWRGLLRRADGEIARFLGFYEESVRIPEEELDGDRLDRCALAMGWHLSSDDEPDASGGDAADSDEENASGDDVPAQEFSAVYSLHNLPESIAVSAVARFAESRWNRLLRLPCADGFSARSASALAGTLASAHRDMLLAIDAEDALEFGLAICLMKNAHAALNRHFAEMENFPAPPREAACVKLIRELRCALMDLRDVCLRILRDSREELDALREK